MHASARWRRSGLLLAGCAILLLGACGESAGRKDELGTPSFGLPPADRLHIKEETHASVPGMDLAQGRQVLLLVPPADGQLAFELVSAPVPDSFPFDAGTPGVTTLWARTIDVKARELTRLGWAAHLTRGKDLLARLAGLLSEPELARLEGLHPEAKETQLAEWRIWLNGEPSTLRGWSEEEWVPRHEIPMSGGAIRPRALRAGPSGFISRDASHELLIGRWSWFFPGKDAKGGTQSFTDARERLRFEGLRPDGRCEAGGRTYAPVDAPYLTWVLRVRFRSAR